MKEVKDHYYSSKQVRLKSNDNPMFDFVYAVVWMDLVDEKGELGDTHVAVKCSNWPSFIRYVPVEDVIWGAETDENQDK